MVSLYSDLSPRKAGAAQQRQSRGFEIQNDDSNGDTLADRYQVLEELGSGSFGVVYKAIEKATGEIVAIKHVDLESSEEDLSDILSELTVLSTCASSHVTKYRLAFLRRQTLWIVMEYLGGGSCADLLKPPPHSLSENHIAIVCRELLLGLSYLHAEGKLHRDIKAANILLAMDGRVKLADFGVAAQLVGLKSMRNTFVGTPFWMAPEVIQQEGHDAKADVWSLGITAMELANGEPPHANIHPMKVLFLIPKQSAPRLEGGKWSRDFRDFVALCLTKDVDRRPSAKELLKHRFIKSAGKIEGLQELIVRKHEWEASKGGERNLKYYAETLRNISMGQNDDDWVFETVKAVPTIDLRGLQTHKRRKVEKVDIAGDDQDSAEKMMEELDINDHEQQPRRYQPTMRKVSGIKKQQQEQETRENSQNESEMPSVRRTATKRVSSTQAKLPLGVNLSFGNSPSTVRQFRRVSPNSDTGLNGENGYFTGSVIITPSKGKTSTNPYNTVNQQAPSLPPRESPQLLSPSKESRFSSNATTIAIDSKETSLGKRLYSKTIGISCQDVLNDTSDDTKREAVARLAEAFSDLEDADPEGLYRIINSVITKISQDKKLKEILPVPSTPSSHHSSSPIKSQPTTLATKQTPTTETEQEPETPQKNAAKLVFAQNNPHLKSHRRRQSAQIATRSRDSSSQIWSPTNDIHNRFDDSEEREMMRGIEGKLEHTRQLADVLFERWCEGLRVRWPAV